MTTRKNRTPIPASSLSRAPQTTSQEPQRVVSAESPIAPVPAEMHPVTEMPIRDNASPTLTADGPPLETSGPSTGDTKSPARVRIPFGTFTEKLAFPPRPGFYSHWFNDKPMRIEQAKQAGYEHRLDAQGKPVSRPVGTRDGGGGMLAYLMDIPQAWRDEDMAAHAKKVDEIDRPIREGKFAEKPGDNRYAPKDSIKFENGPDKR